MSHVGPASHVLHCFHVCLALMAVLPVAQVLEQKAMMKEINTRPPKKVAEAMNRKHHRARRVLRRLLAQDVQVATVSVCVCLYNNCNYLNIFIPGPCSA